MSKHVPKQDQPISIATKNGVVTAGRKTDPANPGVYVDIEQDGQTKPLITVDYTDGVLKVLVWDGDTICDDYQLSLQADHDAKDIRLVRTTRA